MVKHHRPGKATSLLIVKQTVLNKRCTAFHSGDWSKAD